MPRQKKTLEQLRVKINLTTHPDIRAWAEELSRKRRRSVSQLFEDLIDQEWLRQQAIHQPAQHPIQPLPQQQIFYPPQPYPYGYMPLQPPAPQSQQ